MGNPLYSSVGLSIPVCVSAFKSVDPLRKPALVARPLRLRPA
jgi:hypothetical protein